MVLLRYEFYRISDISKCHMSSWNKIDVTPLLLNDQRQLALSVRVG